MDQQTGSKLGKEYVKAVYCHPAYLAFMQSILYEMLGWMTHRVQSRFLGEISTNSLRYAESEEELKSLLRVKEENEKAGLKLSIIKTKIMSPGPITSWQIEGNKEETAADFIFLGFKITEDCDYGHGVERCLFLGKKAMTNLDSILQSRDITLLTKMLCNQSYGFSSSDVQM